MTVPYKQSAIVLLLAVIAAAARAGEGGGAPGVGAQSAPSFTYPVHGSVDMLARWRGTVRDSDWDAASSLRLDAGDPARHLITASLSAFGRIDLDGNRETYGIYSLQSPQDSYSSAATGQLLEAFLDVNRVLLLERVRLGRQYSLGIEGARFDGARVDTMDLLPGSPARLTAAFFGGVPVHLWEPSPAGDALAGGRLDFGWSRSVSLGLEGMWVRDTSELWGAGVETRNTMLAARAGWIPSDGWSFRGHAAFRNRGTSDLRLEPSGASFAAAAALPSAGLRATADLTARLETWDDSAAEFNAYDPVAGEGGRFTRGRIALSQSLGAGTEIEAGGTFYDAGADSAAYDRDMLGGSAGVRNRDAVAKGLELGAFVESFDPAGEESRIGAHAETALKLRAGGARGRKVLDLWARGGFVPYAYERNADRIRERVVFVRVGIKWWPAARIYAGAEFRFENDEVDLTYGVDFRAGFAF